MSVKSAFGTIHPVKYQSDVVNQRKKCTTADQICGLPIHPYELIISQYSTMNLSNVTTISGTATDGIPFYQTNQIDPTGALYGKTKCGLLNYTHFLQRNALTFGNR
jgi:hypothetical protein